MRRWSTSIGPLLGCSANEVQDQIDITRDLLEALRLVIDRPIGAEFADEVEVLGCLSWLRDWDVIQFQLRPAHRTHGCVSPSFFAALDVGLRCGSQAKYRARIAGH
jgi:hypothetical protein